ncbi:exopolyphosphatase PRUNE1-like [Coccinella septempunctata]|uniref:exopolyphosphatase PRUNE1-like n=1 Tax=Coccinella septempunctata TaxID=41139 RepID=UPI001D0966EF|nr:exopolyphosphatase PRUNE1-like [Coccinella septempunctata]
MDELNKFLEESYERSLEWGRMNEIHIVLGNEAGDLDSVMSTIAYAHFLYSTTKHQSDDRIAFFPVLNFDRDGMDIRSEHKYLFEQADINLDKLIYRNQLNFEEMVRDFGNTNRILKTYLVDHHQLRENDEVLRETVCRIFDHRPLDKYYSWTDFNMKMRIEKVASCCTLVADELFKETSYEVDSKLAHLMYCAIVYDTKGRDRPGTLDEEMKSKLWTKSTYRLETKEIFKILDELHCKCDHLTPLQILTRDLKFEKGILFPRLSMLAVDFMKFPNAYDAIDTLCHQYKSDLAVLICTRKSSNEQLVDVGVFFSNLDCEFKTKFVKKFNEAKFALLDGKYDNFSIFKFLGKKIGRKKILPLVLEIYENIKGS